MPTAMPSRARASPWILAMLRRLSAAPLLWLRWNERHRQRQALSELDDRLLDDVGLTRRQADSECRKPPWR
jgi:uncharacterized protein YjiS (DUF1127 family)